MKSSSEKITIDGKEKSCTKVEVTLKDKDIADLIGKYLDKFENDEKGREIIIDKISKYSKLSGQEIDKDELEEYIDQIIEKTRDSLDNFEFDGDVKITSYATLLSIYRVDIEYSEGNNSIEISTEFNGKKSETTIKIADQKICKINIKNEKDEKEYKISFNEDLIKGKFDITMNYKSEKNKNTTSFDIEAEFNGQEAYISVSNEEKRTTDTKNELSTENEISFDIDIPNYMTTKGKIMIDGTLEIIDSVDVPKLSKDNSVNIYDTEGMNEYGEEIEKGLMTILGNMQTSNFVQQLIIDNNNQKSMVY